MLFETSLVVGTIYTAYKANESMKMDEKSLQKYAKAYEKSESARMKVEEKKEYLEKRLENVVKKKQAILNYTFPHFEKTYDVIQKVVIQKDNSKLQKDINTQIFAKHINSVSIITQKQPTVSEMICAELIKGVSGIWEMDSKRLRSAANSQMRVANVIESQAENICVVYDGIVARADRIASVIVRMNALLNNLLKQADLIIEQKGMNKSNYTAEDKTVFFMCAELAAACADMINVPVVNKEGKIEQQGLRIIQNGEEYISQMQEVIGEYQK